MSSSFPNPLLSSFTTSFFLISLMLVSAAAAGPGDELIKLRKEKKTHLHFYFHDTVSGPNPSAIRVVSGPSRTSPLGNFGDVFMADDPLTEGPNLTSKLVGRAQGLYAVSSMPGDLAFLFTMNLVFLEGKYNGSTLSILGRDAVLETVREMPVTGGSGHFRFARGYALAKTYQFNLTSGDAIVEYNVYVMHY